MKKLFLLILFFGHCSDVLSQKRKNLEIGDSVPNVKFTLLNDSVSSLYNYDDKLIILDFWATWCGNCIVKFPMLDSMQQKYSKELQFILVNTTKTKDTKDKIINVLEKRRRANGDPLRLLITIRDSVFRTLFLHVAIPHYVWIKDHKVVAITGSKYITWESISKALIEKRYDFPVKDDAKTYGLNN